MWSGAHAQSQQPQSTAPAAPPAADAQEPAQVTIRPIDVNAAKPKKPKKQRAAAGAGAPAAQPVPAAPVTEQAKTQIGRLTTATPVAGTTVQREQIEDVRPPMCCANCCRMFPASAWCATCAFPSAARRIPTA
jgi:hypothetical protein